MQTRVYSILCAGDGTNLANTTTKIQNIHTLVPNTMALKAFTATQDCRLRALGPEPVELQEK